MRIIDIILKKRNGEKLSREEIDYMVREYTLGNIPDYQVSALLMAIYFQKLDDEETAYLTESMMNSGEIVDLRHVEGIKVDKHSTGGVGDKTTIALAPIVAACGVPVAKMSGRGLGHTGGTLDKLESIPGFNVNLTKDEFINQVNEIKVSVIGQTSNLVPADKKLYALRDVTATVDNISLIASSIMSKKLASGADAIVLDVKTGSGAFMQDINDSFELAKEMVQIGTNMNRETVAIISDMDQPLGYAVGNCLEIKEAIDVLLGRGPEDLKELCIVVGAHMILLAKKADDLGQAKAMIEEAISSGKAFSVFKEFVERQGGDITFIDNIELLPKAKEIYALRATKRGYIHKIHANTVGLSAMILGAGREHKDSIIDLSVGIVLNKKCGDFVTEGDVLAYIHSNNSILTEQSATKMITAFKIEQNIPEIRPLIFGTVTKESMG
ncbi:pyrimidine-nucleoside phosphorylase [Serpentinicella alkaliphila]|uniref:Pyrimidine-nucleoside phosphorylase n=1 Tax=Serpentinicella alkaliphila TaxID=1734049 RepID=A0A4R2TJI9_9FIRM|nr:pyrimidine-nucleoside phosphorylase [Serpentinicella alkaliphila]QUH26588.1 pyrimidine-nucleoside phosphorylase [Serpentinicella alkaliphila]TCQ02946.1 thymidine phosphorylase [Serpentinicella alkaliphila]